MSFFSPLELKAIRDSAERHGVAELSLFGSATAGDFDENSDLDFLVDFLPGREDPFEDFGGLREDIEAATSRKIDLVIRRAIRNPYFLESALAQAEKIYVAGIHDRVLDVPVVGAG